MTNPFQHVAAELARFAINVDLVADQVNNRPEPLTAEDAHLLTFPITHLWLALGRLEEALHEAHRPGGDPREPVDPHPRSRE